MALQHKCNAEGLVPYESLTVHSISFWLLDEGKYYTSTYTTILYVCKGV